MMVERILACVAGEHSNRLVNPVSLFKYFLFVSVRFPVKRAECAQGRSVAVRVEQDVFADEQVVQEVFFHQHPAGQEIVVHVMVKLFRFLTEKLHSRDTL